MMKAASHRLQVTGYRFRVLLLATCSLQLATLFGCASVPKVRQEALKPIFYPPEAGEPQRLQYLVSFSSSQDLECPSSVLKKFIIGDTKNIKPIIKPYGVAVQDKKIFICDTAANAVDILDLDKKKFEYFTSSGESYLLNPINLAFDKNANMYVADAGRGQVLVFDKNRAYSGSVGQKTEFKPTDVKIKADKIYICDLKTHSVKVYRLADRRYLFSLPLEGAGAQARLFSPTNIAIDDEGNVYVSDTGAARVQKYNADGEFLTSTGSLGDVAGQFTRPKGISVDDKGRFYVVDAAFENVQLFNKKGKLLLAFAGPGTSPVTLVLPAGIAVDYSLLDYFFPLVDPGFEAEYLVLVTSQYGDKKLSIFAFGHKK